MFRSRRGMRPGRGPRPLAFVGAAVAVILLQQLISILGNLVVTLLPEDWVRRSGRLIVAALVVTIILLLYFSQRLTPQATTPQRRPATEPPPQAGTGATALPSSSTSRPSAHPPPERRGPRWAEVLGAAREAIAEVLAIFGWIVRWLFWLASRSADSGRNVGTQLAGGTQPTTPTPAGPRRPPKPKPSWDEERRNIGVGVATVSVLLFFMIVAPDSGTGTGPGAAAALSRQVDADSLARASRAWPQDPPGRLRERGYARSFVDRTYRIAVERADLRVTSLSADPLLRSLGDTRVQVSARASGTVSLGRFGVICRHRSERYYLASITDAGNYQLAKVTGAGKRVLDEGFIGSMRQATVSVVELACTGGEPGSTVRLDLVVNGRSIANVEDKLQPLLRSGGVGVYAETGTDGEPDLDVAFEDFYVWTR
jgi:hypothetical protein